MSSLVSSLAWLLRRRQTLVSMPTRKAKLDILASGSFKSPQYFGGGGSIDLASVAYLAAKPRTEGCSDHGGVVTN